MFHSRPEVQPPSRRNPPRTWPRRRHSQRQRSDQWILQTLDPDSWRSDNKLHLKITRHAMTIIRPHNHIYACNEIIYMLSPPRTKPLVAIADVDRPVMDVTTIAMRTMPHDRAAHTPHQNNHRTHLNQRHSRVTSREILTDTGLTHNPRHPDEQHHAPNVQHTPDLHTQTSPIIFSVIMGFLYFLTGGWTSKGTLKERRKIFGSIVVELGFYIILRKEKKKSNLRE